MRSQLLTSKQQLAEDIQNNSTAYKKKFTSLNLRITQARRRLCHDAAAIFDLQFIDGKSYIGNLSLPDFDTIRKQQMIKMDKTSYAIQLAGHLLVLFALYLGLKLPFELQPPVLNEEFSVVYRQSKKVLRLNLHGETAAAENDALNNSALVLSVLAYDVAWVAYSQGINVKDTNGRIAAHQVGRMLDAIASQSESSVDQLGPTSHSTAYNFMRAAVFPVNYEDESYQLDFVQLLDIIRHGLTAGTSVVDDNSRQNWELVPGDLGLSGRWTNIYNT